MELFKEMSKRLNECGDALIETVVGRFSLIMRGDVESCNIYGDMFIVQLDEDVINIPCQNTEITKGSNEYILKNDSLQVRICI